MKKHIIVLMLIISVLSGCSGEKSQPAAKIPAVNNDFIVAGSGGATNIVKKLVAKYNQEFNETIKVPAGMGSGGGIKAVSDGTVDIGLTSRSQTAEERKLGLVQLPFARVAITIAVSPDVPDDNITYQELVDIYRGEKTTWANGREIIVQVREEGDSSTLVLEKEITGFAEAVKEAHANRRWQVYYSGTEALRAIEAKSSTIGFIETGAIALYQPKIKLLKVNQVAPTLDNVKNDKYKLFKDTGFVYKHPLSQRGQKFLDWVYSPAGQEIISANGAIPLKGK